MNVLKEKGRKILFLSLGMVMAAGVAIFGPTAPANACYNGNGCGGQQQNGDWSWRCDSPAGGCGYVESYKWNWQWHCVNGVWNLDPPGQYNGYDHPNYGQNSGYWDNWGNWVTVFVGVG